MTSRSTTDTPARIIRFLRDCYEADNRETTLFDLRHEKVEHLQFLSHGGEFLTGTLDRIPVDCEAGLAAQKTGRLYETEKTLVFCALLPVGRLGKTRPPLSQEIFARCWSSPHRSRTWKNPTPSCASNPASNASTRGSWRPCSETASRPRSMRTRSWRGFPRFCLNLIGSRS